MATQVVMMSSINFCSNLPSLPFELTYATGGVLNGSLLICGGERSKSCYIYEKTSNAWKFLTYTNTSRYRDSEAATVTNGALLLTGGFYGIDLSITEFIFSNGSIIRGPDMPTPRSKHCMVTLDDGRVMILGGERPNSKNVLIFDPKNKTFTDGPNLNYGRYDAACTVFVSPLHGNKPMVLSAGGYEQITAEVLDYTNTSASWQNSKCI